MKTLKQRMETELDSSLYLCHDFDKIESEFLRLAKAWLTDNKEAFENKSHKVEKPEDVVIVAGIYRLAATTCNGLIRQLENNPIKEQNQGEK